MPKPFTFIARSLAPAKGKNQDQLARALNNLGVIAFRQGKFAEAETLLQQSLVLRRRLGDPKWIADSLNNLGILLHALEAYEREQQLLLEALATYRQLDDRKGIGTVLHNLGGVQLALAHYPEAHVYEKRWTTGSTPIQSVWAIR